MKFRSLNLLAITAFMGLLSPFILANPDGFLSIDCGASNNKTDEYFDWVTDSLFIKFRNAATVPPLGSNLSYQYQSLAYFTNLEAIKYCYLLPVTPHALFLLRATFSFGGFEALSLASVFDLIVDGIKWRKVDMGSLSNDEVQYYEIILAPKSETLTVCLARNSETQDGHYVFISTIELRPLQSPMYNSTDFNNNALVKFSRINFGSSDPLMYPEDPFDRYWNGLSTSIQSTTRISTNSSDFRKGLWNKPPLSVLQTGLTSPVGQDLLISNVFVTVVENGFYYFALYFCNIINETSLSGNRTFQVFINNLEEAELIFPSYLYCWAIYGILNLSAMETPGIRLSPLQGSDVGPFINAAELYQMVNINNMTDAGDRFVIRKIANTANFPDDWTAGDPCLPAGFPITGVFCNEETPPRVIIVNLTNRGLTGDIPPSIASLTALTQLLLGNNSLTGSIPDLSTLKNLTTLQLQNNQLTGGIPSSLEKLPLLNELFLENNKLDGAVPAGLHRAGLNLQVNPQNKTSHKKNSKERLIIGLAIGCSILLIVVISGVLLWRHKYDKKDLTSDNSIVQTQLSSTDKNDSNNFQKVAVEYTEEDIKAATKNYSTFLGKGGFGSVYYGQLSGNDVAVKKLSTGSFQGKQEFRNEVTLLSRVHHKNLVNLIGYCRQPIEALVYEFMECGTLTDHLHGPAKLEKPLDWQTRVNIAHQAAEAVLYLHEGCSPTIIHRDIKCSNILLDKRMFAKISDFGLSKLLDNSRSYITTNVKGTLGYLDPEYFGTSSLNEKSDVYSFGVVLLEIISGVPPRERLVESAKELLSCGRLADLMDPSLGGRYNLASAWKVAEIAYTCVELRPVNRPTMNIVARELAEAKVLLLDDNGGSGYASTASSNGHEMPQLR